MGALTIRSRHVPPATPFPLPLLAVQVGHSTGNLRSLRRVVTCPRKQSRQNVCPQDSGRMIKSSCISSKHMPHTNNRRVDLARRMIFARRVDLASSVGRAERARSSFLDSCCGRTAHGTLSSRAEGGIGGSARRELEPANGESG